MPPKLVRRRGAAKKRLSATVKVLITVGCLTLAGIWLFLGLNFYSALQKRRTAQESGPDPIIVQRAYLQSVKQSNSLVFPPKFPVVDRLGHEDLDEATLDMCDRTLWHTLETTTIVMPDGDTFIHTGDIDDLWLRDSASQIHPLLVPFGDDGKSLVASDARLARVVSGLIQRTAMYIRHDPYANAFRIDDTYVFSEQQKRLGRHDLISTWNYELDSACFYIRMIYYFYKALPDHQVLRKQSVQEAVDIMLDVWIAEQNHEGDAFPTGPLFDCKNCNKPYRYPGLPRNGKGAPTAPVGLTWTGFRPSDDECTYNYLIPANMFCVVALQYVQELAVVLWNNSSMRQKAAKLEQEIDRGLSQHAIVNHAKYGRVYAYEVDGLGNFALMDDANVPSLMSIPYIGYKYDPDVYANTKRFILSEDNPTYHKGKTLEAGEIEGYGSPHMSRAIQNNIWPMSLAVQALSSEDSQEKLRLVSKLVKSTGGTGWMHESFDVTNPKRFTRSWFCWADSLFAELVMTLSDQCPRQPYHIMKWNDPEGIPGGKFAAS